MEVVITKPFDFDKICRICLSEDGNIPIYANVEGISYAEMLRLCTFLQPSESDGFPSQICVECSNILSKTYDLKYKCVINNTILQEYVKIRKTEIENLSFSNLLINTDITNNNNMINFDVINNLQNENQETQISDENTKLFPEIFVQPSNIEIELIEVAGDQFTVDNLCMNNLKKPPNGNKPIKKPQEIRNKKVVPMKPKEIKDIRCEICNWEFSSHIGLIRHRTIHDPVEKCKVCSKIFLKTKFNLHLAEDHTGYIKNSKNSKKIEFEKSEVDNNTEEIHTCEVCKKEFSSSMALLKHKQFTIHEPLETCKYCSKMVTKSSLFSHILIKHPVDTNVYRFINGKYKCVMCQKSFVFLEHLRQHYNSMHNMYQV